MTIDSKKKKKIDEKMKLQSLPGSALHNICLIITLKTLNTDLIRHVTGTITVRGLRAENSGNDVRPKSSPTIMPTE